MMLSMFVNDWRDDWNECFLPQDVSTDELRTNRVHDLAPHPFATWVRDAIEVAYDHVRHSLHCTAARRKRLYDVKAVNHKCPVGSWVLHYYPPAAQKKLGFPLQVFPYKIAPTSRTPSYRPVSDLTGVSTTGSGGVAEDNISGDNDSTTGISTTWSTGEVREDP